MDQAEGWDISGSVTAETVTEREVKLAQSIARAEGSYIAEESRRVVASISEKLIKHREILTRLASNNASDTLSTRIKTIQGEMSELEFQKNKHLGVIANFRADSETITERNALEAVRKRILEKKKALAGLQEKFDSGAFDDSPKQLDAANQEADAIEKELASLQEEEKTKSEAYDKIRSAVEIIIDAELGYIDPVKAEREQIERDVKAAANAKVREEKKKSEKIFWVNDNKVAGKKIRMNEESRQR